MARVYKSKNVQTQPHLAGEKNMTKAIVEKAKDKVEDDLMASLIPVYDQAIKQRARGTNWTEDELKREIRNYFTYCAEKYLKPSKSSLRIWLGCSRSQYHAWQSETAKYGAISDLINLANDIMETQYINRGEKYPTMNVFLLKSSHEHQDKQEVEISNKSEVDKGNIEDVISKLNLDK